jgi:hypoxanthine phosphoribosyltransferase
MYPLLRADEIQAGVERLAGEIDDYYLGRELTVIGVMTGSIVLLADLIRHLDRRVRVGVIQARSYRGGTTTPGPLSLGAEMLPDLRAREVLVVDDIFDSGQTLYEIIETLAKLGPSSLRTAVLLRKDFPRRVPLVPDHVAFEIPNCFVVGYGLDYHDEYRNLPFVAVLEESDLAPRR